MVTRAIDNSESAPIVVASGPKGKVGRVACLAGSDDVGDVPMTLICSVKSSNPSENSSSSSCGNDEK